MSEEPQRTSILVPAAIVVVVLLAVYVGTFLLWYHQATYRPFLGSDPQAALERERMLFKPLVWLDRKVIRRQVWGH